MPGQQLSNVRYGFFDALRGFTMLLVVFSHVFYHSLGIEVIPINLFFSSFRMPLFFFVSGFFAYKSLEKWNNETIKDIIFRKFKVQIVGTSIFLSLFVIFKLDRLPTFYDYTSLAQGYWFTYTLFAIFSIYMLIVLITKSLHVKSGGYFGQLS